MAERSTWHCELDIWQGTHLLGYCVLALSSTPKTVLGHLLGQLHPFDDPKSHAPASPECVSWGQPVILLVALHHDEIGIPGLVAEDLEVKVSQLHLHSSWC